MPSILDSDFEDKISTLVEEQFPAFYREEGPLFIAFTKEFYKWLETGTYVRSEYFCDNKFGLNLEAGNAIVTGVVSEFTTQFANGDRIAICRGVGNNIIRTASTYDYEIFTIDTIANNSYLTLTTDKLPEFSAENRRYGPVRYQSNPMYYGRNFLNIKDIDNTFDEFLIYFKEKYLKNITLNTLVDTRQVVKHSLDIYRSKGTERSLDLLFKMVYGITPRLYYPGRDLFRLSDGYFKIPKYLEISLKENSTIFVSKEIYGITSKATAFCESVIRRTVSGKLIDVLYISNINGNFQTGELVNTIDDDLAYEECPYIAGSLTEIEVDTLGIGSGFAVGDIVNVTSFKGQQARARVAATANSFGSLSLSLVDGGYGYTANSQVLVSNNLIRLDNFVLDANNISDEYFHYFYDRLVQPTAIINYIDATDNITVNSAVFTYHANNDLKGSGLVLSKTALNSTAGEMTISILSGNMEASRFYTTSNAMYANQAASNGYFDTTCSGNVIGIAANVEINVVGITGTFQEGERLIASDARGEAFYTDTYNIVGANGTIRTSNCIGVFADNTVLMGVNSGATANIVSINMYVGLTNVTANADFITTEHNYIYSTNAGGNATCTYVGEGYRGTFGFSNNFEISEVIELNSDYIWDHRAVELDAATWPLFAGYPTANLTTGTIQEILTYSNVTIGKINTLINVDGGVDYNHLPLIKIFEPLTVGYVKEDTVVMEYTGATGTFETGEIINQSATSDRGMVLSTSNSTHLYVQRLRWHSNNQFVITANSTTTISGEDSGTTANVTSVQVINSAIYGLDAVISANLATSNGAVTSLQVIDSGFGFVDYETVEFETSNGAAWGEGVARVLTHGQGTGYYLEAGGVLSGKKKLFDGYYWQEYSYEVRSSLTLNKYSDMLKQILHVAGTKMFGAMYHDSDAVFEISTETQIDIN